MINLFITDINTNCGKEQISAGLAATMQSLGYQSCIYKPIDIGAIERNGFVQSFDLAYIKNIDPYIETAFTYIFKDNMTPYIAAEAENIRIDRNRIKNDYENISKNIDCLITMGTQGILTPIDFNFSEVDLVKFLSLPVLIIVRPSPDAINQTLLTVSKLEEKNLEIRGIIINDNSEYRNELKHLPRLIEEYSNAKILGIVQDFSNLKNDANELINSTLNGIDIESVFNIQIAKLNV